MGSLNPRPLRCELQGIGASPGLLAGHRRGDVPGRACWSPVVRTGCCIFALYWSRPLPIFSAWRQVAQGRPPLDGNSWRWSRWGRSLFGGGLSEALPVGRVAVSVCCTALRLASGGVFADHLASRPTWRTCTISLGMSAVCSPAQLLTA